MAVIVYTTVPNQLLKDIKKAIDDNTVRTWEYDSDGDFTHTAEQWKLRAWLRPTIAIGQLRLNIFPPRQQRLSSTTYGIYHGRFIEMLLNHFDSSFSSASATAMPVDGDRVVST